MSGFINTPIARAPRQSGLKKPRPLRSVSLQEGSGQNVKKDRPERQISSDYPSNAVREIKHFPKSNSAANLGCVGGFQNSLGLPDTYEGSHRADSSGSVASSQDAMSPTGFFQRQNSVTSQDSNCSLSQGHSRKSSMEALKQVDANANDVESPQSDSTSPYSISSLHKTKYGSKSASQEDKESRENLTLATLVTTKGKQLVLSGTCIQTILNSCRALLHEMGASIVRLETVELPNAKTKDIPDSPTESESSPTIKSRLQYTKKELLAMSESDLSRKPPAMWNILAPTHADCCIPASKLLEYFEQIDFHPHDGTLVAEEPAVKRRDRRE